MEQTSTPDRKRLISELTRGRDCATRLQNLLRGSIVEEGSESAEDLVMNIIGSFSDSLSMFSSCPNPGHPATSYVGPASLDDRTWESSETDEKKPALAVKERRTCYKRRVTEDKRVEIKSTYEDGYAWRKYGQKEIQHAKFPRLYYRCTYKDEGCKAVKYVQKLEDGSERFRVTYFGSHTCQHMNNNTQMFPDSEDANFSLINFEGSMIKHSPSNLPNITNALITTPSSLPNITNVLTTPLFVQDNSHAQGGGYLASSSLSTSSNDVWEDMLDDFGLSFKDDICGNDFKFY